MQWPRARSMRLIKAGVDAGVMYDGRSRDDRPAWLVSAHRSGDVAGGREV
jgi:hypothetical protein